MESETAYQDFLQIPPFKQHAAEVIWEYLSVLKVRMQKVINK